jgi:hypothetical protein
MKFTCSKKGFDKVKKFSHKALVKTILENHVRRSNMENVKISAPYTSHVLA